MYKTITLVAISLLLTFNVNLAIAADQASGSFQVEQTSTTVPLRALESSTNYTVDSGVAGIVGSATSGSFLLNSNETQPAGSVTPTPPPPPPPPPPPSGGGGGSVIIPTVGAVTLSNDVTCPIYKTSVTLFGTKETNVESVEINGSSTGVTYATGTSWEKIGYSLTLGTNNISINGKTDGARGATLAYQLKRQVPGDITGDGFIDDFDLSILASSWGKVVCKADFNKDRLTDDFDLSILVSSWTNKI